MAFIKANNQFDIGTKVRLSRNIESMSGTLLKGTIVTITGKTPHGYNIEDAEGHRMYECGWDIGTKIAHDGTPSEYLAYITAYLLVTFENGMVATAHVNCDMADPAGTQAFLDEFYQTAWQMYDKPNMTVKDVKYIDKETYDKIAKMEGPDKILHSETWKDDKIMIRTSEQKFPT